MASSNSSDNRTVFRLNQEGNVNPVMAKVNGLEIPMCTVFCALAYILSMVLRPPQMETQRKSSYLSLVAILAKWCFTLCPWAYPNVVSVSYCMSRAPETCFLLGTSKPSPRMGITIYPMHLRQMRDYRKILLRAQFGMLAHPCPVRIAAESGGCPPAETFGKREPTPPSAQKPTQSVPPSPPPSQPVTRLISNPSEHIHSVENEMTDHSSRTQLTKRDFGRTNQDMPIHRSYGDGAPGTGNPGLEWKTNSKAWYEALLQERDIWVGVGRKPSVLEWGEMRAIRGRETGEGELDKIILCKPLREEGEEGYFMDMIGRLEGTYDSE